MDILAWRKKEKGQGVIHKRRHQILGPEGSNSEEKLVAQRNKMATWWREEGFKNQEKMLTSFMDDPSPKCKKFLLSQSYQFLERWMKE